MKLQRDALKLTTFKDKIEKGENMLVVDDTIRGEIMALIVTCFMSHQDDYIGASTGRVRADLVLPSLTCEDRVFMHRVHSQVGTSLVELLEAVYQLELWQLFELCFRTIAAISKSKLKT